MKTAGYPLHSPLSPSLLLPCVAVCHQIPFPLYDKAFSGRRCDGVFSGKDWESPERVTLEWKCKGTASHGKYGGRYGKLLDGTNIPCGEEYYRLHKKCRTINLKSSPVWQT